MRYIKTWKVWRKGGGGGRYTGGGKKTGKSGKCCQGHDYFLISLNTRCELAVVRALCAASCGNHAEEEEISSAQTIRLLKMNLNL